MAMPSFSQMDKRQQLALVIGGPVLVIALLGYLSWGILKRLGPDPKLPGMLQRPGGIWSEITELDTQIKLNQDIINRRPRVEAELQSLTEEIATAEQRLPLEAEKTDVRQLIERIARDVPTTLGTVQFKAVKIIEGGIVKGQDYQTITYSTEIAADLNGIIKYIDQIEKNTRFMAVKNLSIKPGGLYTDNEQRKVLGNLHSVNLDIVTYVYTAPGTKRRK